jgi:D-aspartate ligase
MDRGSRKEIIMTLENQSHPAVILGCHKIGWSIIRSLGEAGIKSTAVFYNNKEFGRFSRYVSLKLICPDPNVDEKSFIAFLMNPPRSLEGGVLIPSSDAMLLSISKFKDILSGKYSVAAPSWSIVEKCLIKKHTYELAHKINVRAPATKVPSNSKEASDFAETIGYPCLVKPCLGHRFNNTFHKKMLKVGNNKELLAAVQLSGQHGHEIMIQEFIPGDDTHGVNYNAFWIMGKPSIEKVRLSPPQIGFPRVVTNKKIDKIIEPARKMLSALSFDGFACMEFKRDARNGDYVLMEINPRLNLSLLLSVKTRVNFASIVYDYYAYNKPPVSIEKDLPYRQRWYWIDTEKDILESLKDIARGSFSISNFLRPYLHKQVSVSLPLSDPLPFIIKLFYMFFSFFSARFANSHQGCC